MELLKLLICEIQVSEKLETDRTRFCFAWSHIIGGFLASVHIVLRNRDFIGNITSF